MNGRFVFTTALAVALLVVVLTAPVPLAAAPPSQPPQGGCPSVNAFGNFETSTEVTVTIADDGTATGTINYSFAGFPKTGETLPGNGIPGLIQYCVYPAAGSLLPSNGGADYEAWIFGTSSAGDYFSFKRPHGDPTNVPYDGTEQQIGHASCCGSLPAILLHVNDPAECNLLYGGNPGTCFVYPGLITGPSPSPPPR
jgi:hypothetical protein